jgi:hypothetical protein
MEVIYFSKEKPTEGCRFLKAVRQKASGRRIVAISDVEEFKGELAGKRRKGRIAIIVASDEQALIDIYFARSFLGGVSSILVLPDHEKLTAALAFRIRPDYTFPADAGVGAITSAVNDILREEEWGYVPPGDFAGPRVVTPPARFVPGGGQKAANF